MNLNSNLGLHKSFPKRKIVVEYLCIEVNNTKNHFAGNKILKSIRFSILFLILFAIAEIGLLTLLATYLI
jgi:hypothetical protein